MSYKIPGLVAESISQELFDKIKDVSSPKIISNRPTMYVGTNGNDDTANGSQEKPFKTLLKCIEHIKTKYISVGEFNNITPTITIKFVTDYIQDRLIISDTNIQIVIDGENHNITIKNYIQVTHGYLTLKNLSINDERTNGTELITAWSNGFIYLQDCVVNIINRITTYYGVIKCRYSSYLEIRDCTFNCNNNISTLQYIATAYQGSHLIIASSNFIINNATINHPQGGFLAVYDNGYIFINTSVNFTGKNCNGKKYYIDGNGTIETNGRGESIFLGTEDGVIEHGWLI